MQALSQLSYTPFCGSSEECETVHKVSNWGNLPVASKVP